MANHVVTALALARQTASGHLGEQHDMIQLDEGLGKSTDDTMAGLALVQSLFSWGLSKKASFHRTKPVLKGSTITAVTKHWVRNQSCHKPLVNNRHRCYATWYTADWMVYY